MAKNRKINPKLSYKDIPNMSVDWMDDTTNDHKPFAGEKVQKFIKDNLQQSYGYSRMSSGYIQFFRSADDCDAYDQGDTSKLLHQDSLQGTNVEFRFMNQQTGNIYINGNNAYLLPVTVRSMDVNSDGSETAHDANISLAIQVNLNNGTTTTDLGTFPANEEFTVNITPYVADGATFILVASDDDGYRRTSSRYSVVRANLGLAFQNNTWWATAFRQGDTQWSVPLALDVNVPAELTATIRKDNVNYVTKTVPSSSFSANYALMLDHPLASGGTEGVYELHLELRATDESLASLPAETLDVNIFCVAQSSTALLLAVNNVATELQNYTNNRVFDYAVFAGSGNHTLTIEAEEDGTAIVAPQTTDTVNGTVATYYLNMEMERADNADYTVSVAASFDSSASSVFDTDITATNQLGYAAAAGATLLVKDAGRSNSEANRDKLTNLLTGATISPEWQNMTWSSVDGHMTRTVKDTAGQDTEAAFIRLLSGETMQLPITPLKMTAGQGRTLEIMFQPRNVMNYDTPVIQCLDEDAGEEDAVRKGLFSGLLVKPSRVTLFTNGSRNDDTQSKNFDPEDIIHLAIVVNPAYTGAGSSYSACFIYFNGCLQREFVYSRDLNVSAQLLFGSADADLDIYAVRTYDTALTSDEVVTNAVNWRFSLADKAAFKAANNIKENSKVDFNKVRSLCNVFVWKADTIPPGQPIINTFPHFGMSKGQTISGVLKTFWRDTPAWNKTIAIDLEGQGTTSMEYLRWNAKGSSATPIDFDGGTHTAISKIALKKNFASSMQSHKMGGCEEYDYLARACGAVEAGAPRQAIWQYPFVGFVEDAEGKYTFIGLYTVGPDKGDKPTFGFGDDSIAMEGSDNNKLATEFRVPWTSSTVEVDGSGEKYTVCGQKAWEDSMKHTALVEQRWRPAYNLAYQCSQLILPWKGVTFGGTDYPATLDGLTAFGQALAATDPDNIPAADAEAYEEAMLNEYWLTGTYDLYRYDIVTKSYVPVNITDDSNTSLNLATQLCGKGYKVGTNTDGGVTTDVLLTTALLSGAADDDARNELFKKARLSKFHEEAAQHWDIRNALFSLGFKEFKAATDNKAKNTYPYIINCSDVTVKIRWREDDIDTVGPIENQGKDKKPYCVEFDDNYSDYGMASQSVWNGRLSQFWNVLQAAFATEYAEFMRTTFIPALVNFAPQSDNPVTNVMYFFQHFEFDRAQEYFGAALYNADATFCYEQAHLMDGSYSHQGIALEQLLGDHYSAEKYWFRMRTIYMMSKYEAGIFAAGNAVDTFLTRPKQGNVSFTITPAIYMYPSVQNGQEVIRGERIWPGNPVAQWTSPSFSNDGDTSARINAMSYIRDVGNLFSKPLHQTITVTGPMLRQLYLGSHTADAEDIISEITSVNIGNATSLRVLDLAQLPTLAGTVNLSSCANLREVYAQDTALSSLVLADGGPLHTLVLGDNTATLSLLGKQMLTTLTIGSTSHIANVEMRNCNAYTVSRVMTILAAVAASQLSSVRLAFGSQASPSVLSDADIQTLLALNAAAIETKQFSGYITKSSGSISGSTWAALNAMNITYVGDVQTEVSIGSSDVTITGNACTVYSGDSATFRATAAPASAGTPRFRLYNGDTLVAEDAQGKATYNGATLDCATGALTTTAVATAFVVKVSAYVGSGNDEVESAKLTVTVERTVPMGGFTLTGTKSYTATGDSTLALTPTNSDYTVAVTSIVAELTYGGNDASGDSYLRVTLDSLENLQLKASVLSIPSATREYTLRVTATDAKGNTYEQTETLTVQSIPVTSFSLSGDAEVTATGSHTYSVASIVPANYNRGIASLAASVSTPTSGRIAASVPSGSTSAVTLTVTEMPESTETVHLTVIATLAGGGNVTAEKDISLKVSSGGSTIVIDESVTDPATRVTNEEGQTYSNWVTPESVQAIRDASHRYLGKYVDDGNGGGKMLLCQLSDTDSTKFFDGTTAATLDGTMGDVWMKHPDVYIKATKEGDEVTLDISTSDNGGRLFPESDLIGVYEANYSDGKLRSISDGQSTGSVSQARFHSYAAARGAGFSLVKPQHQNLMAVLFYAMYGHTNCQAVCGAGTNAYNKATGQTNSLGMTDTTTANGNSMSINFWGLENWWGNKYEWMDGAVIDNGVWTITEDDGTIRTITAPTNSEWVYAKKFIWGDGIDVVPLATETGGSNSQGYCDGYYGTTQSSRVALRSNGNAYAFGGVACVLAAFDSSGSDTGYGSRLAFHGQIEVTTDVQAFIAATQKS